jgi:hypothetical protein
MTTSSMAFPVVLVLTCAAMVGPAAVVPRAQTTEANDPFHNVAWLIGRWEGTSEGKAGSGTVERTYDRILGGRFIRVQNRSTYPPQEKNPKGEVHEDLVMIGSPHRLPLRRRCVHEQLRLTDLLA